ncbi:acylphosphatase-2-like [Dysidea avara]|uniref:acylphosphatase-2-like n=1 Tax=Dysidea avara TaxID=196820 RepID=UPI0033314E60
MLRSTHFEVFGKVQGVFFRKHTEKQANLMALKGWVQNTPRGTVVGVIQGGQDAVESMKDWLSTKGSPKSRIDKCVFTMEKSIAKCEYEKFLIRR